MAFGPQGLRIKSKSTIELWPTGTWKVGKTIGWEIRFSGQNLVLEMGLYTSPKKPFIKSTVSTKFDAC